MEGGHWEVEIKKKEDRERGEGKLISLRGERSLFT